MTNVNVENITAEEANNLINTNKDIAILDVRTEREYLMGHIPGALLIPIGELASKINDIKKYIENPVLVYCASGSRSFLAARFLLQSGFKNIYNLHGGLFGWRYSLKR